MKQQPKLSKEMHLSTHLAFINLKSYAFVRIIKNKFLMFCLHLVVIENIERPKLDSNVVWKSCICQLILPRKSVLLKYHIYKIWYWASLFDLNHCASHFGGRKLTLPRFIRLFVLFTLFTFLSGWFRDFLLKSSPSQCARVGVDRF